MDTRILVIGGGFVGVSAALHLAKKSLKNTKITLISDRPHFEYHGALYRLVTGSNPLEVCIPLREIFAGYDVEVLEDKIVSLEKEKKVALGVSGSQYHYDHLVIGLGAETSYFNIPGLQKLSYGMKSIVGALQLKRHITEVLLTCRGGSKDEQVCAANFVVVGGGPTGIEVAGDLIVYARNLATEYGLDPRMVSVELIEGSSRILPQLPERFALPVERRLRSLGVNIFTNRAIEREDVEKVYLKDMELRTKTVIWTAGVEGHHLLRSWGFPTDPRGRVDVDEQFQPKGFQNIYVGGDAVIATYWGMAQTAYAHGAHIAKVIEAKIKHKDIPHYRPKEPIYAVPVGPSWAGVMWGTHYFYGKTGWFLRRVVDLIVFNWVLPPKKALDAFRVGKSICDTCSICSVESDKR